MQVNFSVRDKAILIGLFLSKFDENALNILGFESMQQAFNALGYSIGTKPASIKNYRDEFDPYFPNPRKGWHKRPIREYCKKYFDNFASLDFNSFTELIKSFVFKNYEVQKLIGEIEKEDRNESVAKRLITGKAAEEYFIANYNSVSQFVDYTIQDTTNFACGFDFRLSLEPSFYCIEVKGLNASSGGILMTEKEFFVAQKLREKYCLFIVYNFIDKPTHKYYFDPVNSDLEFKRTERRVLQTSYNALV